jgi:hypothetical protein
VAASARVVYTADRLGKGVFELVGCLPLGYSPRDIRRKTTLSKAGEVVVVDFPGATGIKRWISRVILFVSKTVRSAGGACSQISSGII